MERQGQPENRKFAVRLCVLEKAEEATTTHSYQQDQTKSDNNRHANMEGETSWGLDPRQRTTGN